MHCTQEMPAVGCSRSTHTWLMTLVFAIVLCSVASLSHAAEKRRLEVWHHTTQIYDQAMKDLEQGFEALHPDIDVVTIPTEQIQEKAVLALVGGSPPDIVQLQIGDAMQPGLAGVFSPLPPALVRTMGQCIVEPMRLMVTRQGQVYGVPTNISINAAPILTVDTDAWAAAGLSTELRSLQSWGEMLTAFKHLTKTNEAGVITRPGAAGFLAYPEELFSDFVLWYEGALYAEDGLTAVFAHSQGNQALTTIAELYSSFEAPHTAWVSTSFRNGLVASVWGLGPYSGRGARAAGTGLSVGHVLVPPLTPNANQKWVTTGGWSWFVPKGKESGDTWAWMEYMLSQSAALSWAVTTGEVPADRRILSQQAIMNDVDIHPYVGLLSSVVPYGYQGDWRSWMQVMKTNLQAAIRGQIPAMEALMRATTELAALVSGPPKK